MNASRARLALAVLTLAALGGLTLLLARAPVVLAAPAHAGKAQALETLHLPDLPREGVFSKAFTKSYHAGVEGACANCHKGAAEHANAMQSGAADPPDPLGEEAQLPGDQRDLPGLSREGRPGQLEGRSPRPAQPQLHELPQRARLQVGAEAAQDAAGPRDLLLLPPGDAGQEPAHLPSSGARGPHDLLELPQPARLHHAQDGLRELGQREVPGGATPRSGGRSSGSTRRCGRTASTATTPTGPTTTRCWWPAAVALPALPPQHPASRHLLQQRSTRRGSCSPRATAPSSTPARTATRASTAATRPRRPISDAEGGAMRRHSCSPPSPAPPWPFPPAQPRTSARRPSPWAAIQRDSDTDSSKFLEYRDIPQGGGAAVPALRGQEGRPPLGSAGRGRHPEGPALLLPLREGAAGSSGGTTRASPTTSATAARACSGPWARTNGGLSNTVQQAYQNAIVAVRPTARSTTTASRASASRLPHLLQPALAPGLDAAPANIDLKLTRGRSNLVAGLHPREGSFELGLTYMHERRSGTRAANGTSFGFGNVVETPEPSATSRRTSA